MKYLVIRSHRSGTVELTNVLVVEASDPKAACKLAAERDHSYTVDGFHAEPLDELQDGWAYYT